VPASPTPLTPTGGRAAHRVQQADDIGQIVGARHRVVHERAGDELAARIVV